MGRNGFRLRWSTNGVAGLYLADSRGVGDTEFRAASVCGPAARPRLRGEALMNHPAPPFIECEQSHAGLAVGDIATAVDFYVQKLGFRLRFTWGDPPTFAGV